MTATVKMQRDGESADVHPDEVDNFSLYGWALVEVPKPAGKKKLRLEASDTDKDEAE